MPVFTDFRFVASPSPESQGAVKGVYLKGLKVQSGLFQREMDCPVQWSFATSLALESQSTANQGSVVANPICKCGCHMAGHLQVRVAVGRRSTCVLKEAPLNKGPLRFPQSPLPNIRSEFVVVTYKVSFRWFCHHFDLSSLAKQVATIHPKSAPPRICPRGR